MFTGIIQGIATVSQFEQQDNIKRLGLTCAPSLLQSLQTGASIAIDGVCLTVEQFSQAITDAGTVIWNGPMGIFETPAFAAGTRGVAGAVAGTQAFTIAGGGDTVAAVHEAGVAEKLSYISTGGGAFLTLMEGEPLPGVTALEKCTGS